MKSLMVVLATMVVLLMGFALSPAQVYEFSKPNVPVNDDSLGRHQHYPGSAGMHSLVARGDTLYAVWTDNRDGNFKIYFSKSTNGGSDWAPNDVVNDTMRASHFYPAIAVGGNSYLYACWQDDRVQSGYPCIYCARSTDNGLTWGRNVLASPTIGLRSNIALDRNGRVFVSYGAGRPYLCQSTNGGDTFTVYPVTDTGYQVLSGYPSMGIDDSGFAYFAFASPPPGGGAGFVWFTRAIDSGDTSFLPPMIVSDTPTPYWRSHPSLVTKPNGNTYIVYEASEANTQDIYLVRSTDRGRTFGPKVRVNDVQPLGLAAIDPTIAVDSGNGVYVTWCDDRSGAYHGYFAVSTNGGDSFGPSVIIEDTSISATAFRTYQNLELNPISKVAYVIWADERWAPRVAWDIFSAQGVLRVGVEEREVARIKGNDPLLESVYPNPLVGPSVIRYRLPCEGRVQLAVYNAVGQRVCSLHEGMKEAGRHAIRWDGRDQSGKEVRSGIYFVGLEWQELQRQDSQRLVQKLVKLQ